MCVLSGSESKAALLGLKCQEAGEQPFSYLQIVPVESGRGFRYVPELVGQLLLHDGIQFCLVTLKGVKLHGKNIKDKIKSITF